MHDKHKHLFALTPFLKLQIAVTQHADFLALAIYDQSTSQESRYLNTYIVLPNCYVHDIPFMPTITYVLYYGIRSNHSLSM